MASSPLFPCIRRSFQIERWRLAASFRWWRGLGLPTFEFEFRIGFPNKGKYARHWHELLDDDDLAVMEEDRG